MRKSGPSLKFGLNARKPTAAAAAAAAPARGAGSRLDARSAFEEPAEGGSETAQQGLRPGSVFAGGTQTQQAEKLAAEIAAADPSAFAYDEVYDSFSGARKQAKQRARDGGGGGGSGDHRPRYMEKLIETAKQRREQSEVVKERLLAKEREREGEQFADKETFVTAGYRELKEQRERLVAEEEAREAEAARAGPRPGFDAAAAGLYRQLLDRVDREDAAIAAAAAGGAPAPSQPDGPAKPAALGTGLNVMARSTGQRPAGAECRPSDGVADRKDRHQSRPHHSGRWGQSTAKHIEADLDRLERDKHQAQDHQRQALLKKYARRNDDAAVEAARQRYLARKQQAAGP
ncbi:hypothetical protein H4R18_004852 [Coemansia javaensis]|uniref:Nuclear speckle splicing regulatory protein 1 N-terminal domain-containing protein n=1 Tax=Coemansia javaensis TaxID=2761396 RepID=A0A9W8LGB0_9FUNG|nr:hypothetical protein H4R18_004852 [Coemansia javaensis]